MINDKVVALSTPNLEAKDAILRLDPEKFFTEPHYDGFPAVLVRLDAVDPEEIEDLIIEAWRSKAPPDLQAQFPG